MTKKKLASTNRQQTYLSWSIDLLIYTIILNLFVEYSSAITIDSFTISLFTAFVLKALLNSITQFEHRVGEWFKTKDDPFFKITGIMTTLLILFFSKFLILEVIDLIFGDHVSIKGFIPLAAMIIMMIASRKILEKIYSNL